ncbi:MAG: hypothetical protein Tp136SUR676911_19 [Prokaryotic dsDNA virus sp.]|nr:MAG: hypothetical protein Tp136SUR676911_19 [Prokaryotic dsDNA virus sp.]
MARSQDAQLVLTCSNNPTADNMYKKTDFLYMPVQYVQIYVHSLQKVFTFSNEAYTKRPFMRI